MSHQQGLLRQVRFLHDSQMLRIKEIDIYGQSLEDR
nr:MAG TPA: hypothetical protein [Caudoviricetes sp.]DAZ12741.1 MAG TPA: hypothetical protein [Caudoviricetes sp.]